MEKKIIIFILISLLLVFFLIFFGFFKFQKGQISKKIEKAKENALSKILRTNQKGDLLLIDDPEYQIIHLKKR